MFNKQQPTYSKTERFQKPAFYLMTALEWYVLQFLRQF